MSTTDPVTAVPTGKYGQLGIYHQYYIPNAAQAKMCQFTALFQWLSFPMWKVNWLLQIFTIYEFEHTRSNEVI